MRIGLLLTIALLMTGCGNAPTLESVVREATGYLWQAQHEDGGWRSDVHGVARSGQSWTAFTLFHLLDLPDAPEAPRDVAFRRGLAFIEHHLDTSQAGAAALGLSDRHVLDYPVYATAYALRAFLLANDRGLLSPHQERLIPEMATYLLEQQWTASQGVDPSDPAFGGWGIGARPRDSPRLQGDAPPPYADLSHTRRALEALYEAARSHPTLRDSIDAAVSSAGVFLARVQKRGERAYDGGFYYSPVLLDLNKAGMVDSTDQASSPTPTSYATATCDGILALLAAGFDPASGPVREAWAYLAERDSLAHMADLPARHVAWREILFFYHLTGRAEVQRRLEVPGNWRADVLALLAERQRPDGSFVNAYGAPNKEDDPIIATTLALAALRHSM